MASGAPHTAARRVEPELLDALAPDDPRAQRSRRDLARVNALMLQPGIMRGLLLRHAARAPHRLIDLGGGDGRFMLAVARGLSRHWPDVTVTIVDRRPAVAGRTMQAFTRLGWTVQVVQADVFAFLESRSAGGDSAICANLFLHHFEDAGLRRLLATAARSAPLFAACEPRRARLALLGSRMLWAVGCGPVTRYDAPISVNAGFRGQELSRLWPQQRGWTLHEQPARLFTHAFVASRSGP